MLVQMRLLGPPYHPMRRCRVFSLLLAKYVRAPASAAIPLELIILLLVDVTV